MLQDGKTIFLWKVCCKCGKKFKDEMHQVLGIFPMKVVDFKLKIGICKDCQEGEREYYNKLKLAVNLNWSEEGLKQYFLDNPPFVGQELIVFDASYNNNTYALVKVSSPSHTKQKRIVIESYSNGYSGQSFYRNGKNCYSPKGKVKLLPYNAKIADLIEQNGGKEVSLPSHEVLRIINGE